jgi:hypothetical protein
MSTASLRIARSQRYIRCFCGISGAAGRNTTSCAVVPEQAKHRRGAAAAAADCIALLPRGREAEKGRVILAPGFTQKSACVFPLPLLYIHIFALCARHGSCFQRGVWRESSCESISEDHSSSARERSVLGRNGMALHLASALAWYSGVCTGNMDGV